MNAVLAPVCMSHSSPTQIPRQWRAPGNVYQPQRLAPLSTTLLMRGWAAGVQLQDTASFPGTHHVACGMKCCGRRPENEACLTSSLAAEHVKLLRSLRPNHIMCLGCFQGHSFTVNYPV